MLIREKILHLLARDPRRAVEMLFKHRHPQEDAPFHKQMEELLFSDRPNVLLMLFRGSAKTTKAEEVMIIGALFRMYRNGLIIGDNQPRAIERLQAVKHELQTNELIERLFGRQDTRTWQATKIVLPNNVAIQCLGKGQSLRGTKHLDARPDFVFIDDLEDEEDAATPEGREKVANWFFATLKPALTPNPKIRMCATPLNPESLPVRLAQSPDWETMTVPIEYLDDQSVRQSAWPSRYPLEWIDATRLEYARHGRSRQFEQEFLVRARADSDRVFRRETFTASARVRTYEPVYAMYDPARTANKTSAHTGFVVYSWIGRKLVIWESGGHFWLPDQMIDHMFGVAERYDPVEIGVEQDGLAEFLKAPVQKRMQETGVSIPVAYHSAPRALAKDDFIKALQDTFNARLVEFVGGEAAHQDLYDQLDMFPTGRKDVPNALAYAMRRPLPKYDLDDPARVVTAATPPAHGLRYVVAASDGLQVYVALLVQTQSDALHVEADAYSPGTPQELLEPLLRRLEAPYVRTCILPPDHFADIDATGLRPAVNALRLRPAMGLSPQDGEGHLRERLSRLSLVVHTPARWAVRALMGGVPRLDPFRPPPKTPFLLIDRALCSAMLAPHAPLSLASSSAALRQLPDGRKYLSALPRTLN